MSQPSQWASSERSNGEVEGPATAAGQAPPAQAVFQRRRRQTTHASRPLQRLLDGTINPATHKSLHLRMIAAAAGTAKIKRKIGSSSAKLYPAVDTPTHKLSAEIPSHRDMKVIVAA